MILTQTEIEPPTAGLAIELTKIILLTTILTQRASSEPLILTGIWLDGASLTSCLTLRIRYDSRRELEIRELVTSYSMGSTAQQKPYGVGELIVESIRILSIATSVFTQKAMQMARSLISLC
jgi:hypothetical protein